MRTDANQERTIDALVKAGFTVEVLPGGGGRPDLLAGRLGINVLLEMKVKGEDLSADQEEWHRDWRGQVAVAHDEFEALAICLKICDPRRFVT